MPQKAVRKIRGDEPIWVIIHIYMEISQGNSLCSYLKQNKNVIFFFYIIGEQEGGIGPVGGGIGTTGSGEDVGKGCRRVNMVQILCVHICKWKNDAC
jgi:hypothetical protein